MLALQHFYFYIRTQRHAQISIYGLRFHLHIWSQRHSHLKMLLFANMDLKIYRKLHPIKTYPHSHFCKTDLLRAHLYFQIFTQRDVHIPVPLRHTHSEPFLISNMDVMTCLHFYTFKSWPLRAALLHLYELKDTPMFPSMTLNTYA